MYFTLCHLVTLLHIHPQISHPFPTPSSEIPSAKVTEGTDKADGMPDDHYLYSLKDFQPFESNTYRGKMGSSPVALVIALLTCRDIG